MIYKNIHDCPIKTFHRIVESGDVRLLEYETVSEAVSGKKKKYTEDQLAEVYGKMHDDIIDNFGVSDDFTLYFHKRKTVLKLEIAVLEGDQSVKTLLELNRQDLARYKKRLSSDDSEIDKWHVRIRREVENEFKSDMDKMTVFEFYTNLHDINEEARKRKLSNENKRSA